MLLGAFEPRRTIPEMRAILRRLERILRLLDDSNVFDLQIQVRDVDQIDRSLCQIETGLNLDRLKQLLRR